MISKTSVFLKESSVVLVKSGGVIIGILLSLTLIGLVTSIGRLAMGLGASTALTDAYPWGIWIGFDFALIAFSGAGFTMAAVVHILHMKKFQPALRPALLAGLLGYVAVLMLLLLDLGRPDRFYHFIIFWNLHSPLFEISWCVLLYTTILLIEISPDLFGRLNWAWPVNVASRLMTPVAIIGITLSTLHQSTLGTLYLNMPHRIHPLWYTPILPLLFFVSSIMAGLSMAIIAYKISIRAQGKEERCGVADGLAKGIAWVALLYVLLKLGDIVMAGELPALLALDMASLLMGLELVVGVILPMILFFIPAARKNNLAQWFASALILFGVFMNRFTATVFAQKAPPGAAYSPHILEWLSTIGLLAGVILAWYLAVRFLEIFKIRVSIKAGH
ncbi:MAG TPA: polysulfide reductase NrfD [Chloroflexi bacterium]|nr:polysulfide reductase NrfD [Chloroflexota bacterium]